MMESSLFLSLSLSLLALSPIAFSGGDNLVAQGIRSVQGDEVVLLTTERPCGSKGPEEDLGIALRSTDGGVTWDRLSSPIKNAQFTHAGTDGRGSLWLAGEIYLEGPPRDPFVLVPTPGLTSSWTLHTIVDGAASIEGMSLATKGRIAVWVRRLSLKSKGWEGDVFEYHSADNGATWRLMGKTQPRGDLPGIAKEQGRWRVQDDGGAGFVVQRQTEARAGWQTVHAFPWHGCSEQEQSPQR
jgi:hypothetical protein